MDALADAFAAAARSPGWGVECRPWRVDTFKLSNDPDFEAKLVDVVGLYLDRPERGDGVQLDEKTQVQALDRTQPSLPLKPGRGRTMTHDYQSKGTIDLFAALNVGTGEVLHQTRKRHTANDIPAFFKWIDLHTPRNLEIHVVLDNPSAHSAPPVTDWLADPRRDRWHLHFIRPARRAEPDRSWFAQLTNRRLRTGVFTCVDDVVDAIDLWAEAWNENPRPFIWRKTADEIITKAKVGRATLTNQTKSRRTTRSARGPLSLR